LLAALAVAVVLTAAGPGLVLASTVPGTVVTISGLDDAAATADHQARNGAGKIFGYALAFGGLGGVVAGYTMTGLTGVGAGLGTAFIPGMISSAHDAAPAATALLTQGPGSAAWWAPAMALLYLPLLLLKMVANPIFLACLAVALLVQYARRPVAQGGC